LTWTKVLWRDRKRVCKGVFAPIFSGKQLRKSAFVAWKQIMLKKQEVLGNKCMLRDSFFLPLEFRHTGQIRRAIISCIHAFLFYKIFELIIYSNFYIISLPLMYISLFHLLKSIYHWGKWTRSRGAGVYLKVGKLQWKWWFNKATANKVKHR
jgi:hypothetical protein